MASPAHKVAAPLILLVTLAACGADTGSDGAAAAAEVPTLTAVEDLRVGGGVDSVTAFDWPSTIRVGPGDSLWSAHTNEQRIRVWSPDGTLVRTLGRAGDGPGEFRSIGAFGWRGDTLWAYDNRAGRMTLIDAAGNHLGTQEVRFAIESPDGPRSVIARTLLADGTLAGSTSASAGAVAAGEITEVHLLRLTRDGELLDTIAAIPMENGTLEISNPHNPSGPQSYSSQPFSERPLNTPLPDGSGFLTVERPYHVDGAEPRFTLIRQDLGGDTLWRRDYPYTPRPVSEEEVDAIVAPLAERSIEPLGGGRFPAIFPSAAAAEEVIRERLVLPAYHPPVQRLVVGRDGSIWLQRERPAEGQPAHWDVLEADGTPRATALLPADLNLHDADAEHVWGMVMDELDTPYIVRYELRGEGA